MGSTHAWKSPLSILIGARCNDNSDLQLRDGHVLFTPDEDDALPSPKETHAVPPSRAMVMPNKSGRTTYFPFGFGYYSSKNDRANDQSQNDITPSGPPRGAFPPPISESNTDDTRRDVNDIKDYVASHPWYHQHSLVDEFVFNDSDKSNPYDNMNRQLMQPPKSMNDDNSIWQDQKAILNATFNFTNAIIGAGAIGLGGAFASSGGGISILSLLGFAYLTKLSLDLIVDLSSSSEVVRMVREFYENEVRFESENEEEEIEFDQEEILKVEREDDYQPHSFCTPEQDKVNEGEVINKSKYDETTAQVTNERETSLFMAQDQSDENSEPLNQVPVELGMNGCDSLRAGSFSSDDAPLMNIDSDGMQGAHANEKFQPCTYEELGRAAYGSKGRLAVLLSKCLYSFGCLVAYVVVVRDNFGPAVRRLITVSSGCQEICVPAWTRDDDYLTFLVSILVILPLSCPRTIEPLAKFSFVSVVSIIFLALSVMYLYFSCTNPVASQSTFYENWIEIRSISGLFESLGIFVFTFICHHVVNNVYESLPTKLRNPNTWRIISTNSIVLSTEASLAIGIFAYMTFGANTPADVLLAYPPDITLATISRLLLCLTMMLTFPLPFLTCREMLVLVTVDFHSVYYIYGLSRFNVFSRVLGYITILRRQLWTYLFKHNNNDQTCTLPIEHDICEPTGAEDNLMEMQLPVPVQKRFRNWGKKLWIFSRENQSEWWDPTRPLLSQEDENSLLNSSIGGLKGETLNPSPLSSPHLSVCSSEESPYVEESIRVVRVPAPRWLQKGGNGRQLVFIWHLTSTFVIWLSATMAAIKAPSLGDVLDLIGAFTGTLLAFVLPALFSFKLKGYNPVSCVIMSIGGFVGVCGTISSLVKIFEDAHG